MYQVVGVVTWKNVQAGNIAHRKLIPRALDRWVEISPLGAQAFVSRCSEKQTVFTTLFPSSEGVVGDLERQKFRRIVKAVAKDFMNDAEFIMLEGDVTESRTRE